MIMCMELCTRCGEKPRTKGRRICSDCWNKQRRETNRERYAIDPEYKEAALASARLSRIKLAELPCERCGNNPRYKANRLCSDCRNEDSRLLRATNDEVRLAANEANRLTVIRIRQQIIEAYGGACQCCGEDEPMFLTIDHVDRDGADERRKNKWAQGGIKLYRYLLSIGCPTDRYQLLCFNCNSGRERNKGICPHQVPASESNGG